MIHEYKYTKKKLLQNDEDPVFLKLHEPVVEESASGVVIHWH